MSEDVRIDLRSNGTALDLEVALAGLPEQDPLPRTRPPLTAEERDTLRGGKITEAALNDIVARVSTWLQGNDLNLSLLLGLLQQPARFWRVVFSVWRVKDEKLRYELADLPIEMATPPGDNVPLSLNGRISSIVHLLPKVGTPPAPVVTGWPLKLLIVRSSPTDLPKVPLAVPVRDSILALRPDLAAGAGRPGFLQVDILSTEPGADIAGPPTRRGLRTQLAGGYHIVVFLGHGDLRELQPDAVPIGLVQLEDDARQRDAFEARQLSTLMQEFPVPVVLLIGCLTAADIQADQLAVFEAALPKWLRGSQGVAQALINGTSGVQCAIGMRYRIDGRDATLFLEEFFKSLLVAAADRAPLQLGNIELAVRSARGALNQVGVQRLSWAAPVVFRTLGAEPMFPFLVSPPQHQVDSGDQQTRVAMWETLAEINWTLRTDPTNGLFGRVRAFLDDVETRIVNAAAPRAALVMPSRVEVAPDQRQLPPAPTIVDVPVLLHRDLQVRELSGTIVDASRQARITGLTLSAAALAAGFDKMTDTPQPSVLRFQLRRPAGAPATLAAGPLFTVTLEIGDAFKTVYPLNVEALTADPPRALCPAGNAIIAPPP